MLKLYVHLAQAVMLTVGTARIALAQEAVFPSLRAANLNGEQIVLPEGLAGQPNLVLIAFEREQQKDLDTWLAAMPAFVQANPRFRYYECPTIQRPPGAVRLFINMGMRSGIPDKQQRARTITLYIDKASFKKSLKIDSEATTYAVLIDHAGKVLWRAEGTFDDAKGKALRDALAK